MVNLYVFDIFITHKCKYTCIFIADSFERKNFNEFHKSIAIHKKLPSKYFKQISFLQISFEYSIITNVIAGIEAVNKNCAAILST